VTRPNPLKGNLFRLGLPYPRKRIRSVQGYRCWRFLWIALRGAYLYKKPGYLIDHLVGVHDIARGGAQ